MRDWHLTPNDPLSLRFAADVRLSSTDYADDQSWELTFGGAQEPAISIQTRYGGRAGLARLVPMLVIEGRDPIYETGAFAEKPVLRAFAPNYAKITAKALTTLALNFELWVIDSHAIGGRFTFTNTANQPQVVRLELFAQAMIEKKAVAMNLLGLDDGSQALHLGKIGGLEPVLMMEFTIMTAPPVPVAAWAEPRVSPKLMSSAIVPANSTLAIRWVHAGFPSMNDSLLNAYQRLYKVDWDTNLRDIEELSTAVPVIETGNPDWDTTIAFGATVALRSFISPTHQLIYPSIVSARIPSRGFSAQADGTDHGRQWSGQTAFLAYLLVPTAALLSPDLAKGVIRNFLAVQHSDGWIDFKPGLGNQRAGALSTPLLATITLKIYEITGDKAFLAEVAPGLHKFYERWFAWDHDHDGDGYPEWLTAAQSGYFDNPLFARFQHKMQNADINKVEAPDLIAYLVREGSSLAAIDAAIGAETKMSHPLDIESFWNDSAKLYLYRDRDTHQTPTGTEIYRGRGEQPMDQATKINPPNRLIVRVLGGTERGPHVVVAIEGVDANGNHVAESLPPESFDWVYGMGAAITDKVYSQINYVKFDGLSRVYNVEIDSVDLTGQNLTLFTPLWSGGISKAHQDRLITLLMDQAQYGRRFGLSMQPVEGSNVPMFWNVLLLEALVANGFEKEVVNLFKRLMDVQVNALKHDHAFRESYNADTGEGIGDPDDVSGVLPLSVVLELIGVRIMTSRRVWVSDKFIFDSAMKVTQFGVEVTRNAAGTVIRFPSGEVIEGKTGVIDDPKPPVPPFNDPGAPAAEPAEGVIPVNTKRDPTVEIPITQIDFSQKPGNQDNQDNNSAGTTKIPVQS